jgi:hypothetical protein
MPRNFVPWYKRGKPIQIHVPPGPGDIVDVIRAAAMAVGILFGAEVTVEPEDPNCEDAYKPAPDTDDDDEQWYGSNIF